MFVICRASVVRIFYSIYEPTWRLLFGLPDLLDAAPKKIVKLYTCFFKFHGPDRVFWDPPRGALGRVKRIKMAPKSRPKWSSWGR